MINHKTEEDETRSNENAIVYEDFGFNENSNKFNKIVPVTEKNLKKRALAKSNQQIYDT